MLRHSTYRGSLFELFCAAVLSLLAAPALAHHSNAIYDLENGVTIEGAVTRYEWVNPHVYLHVTSRNESGEALIWEIEASPPTLMARRGWSPTTFVAGDRVTVEASPTKIAGRRHMALVKSVRKADGTVLVVNSNDPKAAGRTFASPPTPVPASDLSGTWLTLFSPNSAAMQFVFGPTSWALTGRGKAAVAAYNDSVNPSARCIAFTAPFSMVFPDEKTIEISEDVVTIRSSLDGAERIIHLDVRSHDGASGSNQGHSIGRWEGAALVVDTTRFTARQNGNAFSLASSNEKHLVERFELSEDPSRLIYTFTLEDPEYLAEAVTGEMQWAYTPGREFPAEGCDPENARRYLQGFAE